MHILPEYISAANTNSFAAFTLSKRFPHIIEQIIRTIKLADNQIASLQQLISEILYGRISELKDITDSEAIFWNDFNLNYKNKTYYEIPFFKTEAYIYRRIIAIMGYPGDYQDPFITSKIQNVNENIPFLIRLLDATKTKDSLSALLSATLWGNSADLSQLHANSASTTEAGRRGLLIDDTQRVTAVLKNDGTKHIAYIADNAGLELITDLLLINHLLLVESVDSIVMHLKEYPTFVSDATIADVHLHLNLLQKVNDENIQKIVNSISTFISNGRLRLTNHIFWNSPLHFTELPNDVKKEFSSVDLIIFKGDANYRRLFEDRAWPMTTPVSSVLDYISTSLIMVRTLKSEIMLGLTEAKIKELYDEDLEWLINGKHGLIMLLESN